MSYRDDEAARDERARALIDEIAKLERDQIEASAAERRLDDARRELATLRGPAAPLTAAVAEAPRPPSLATHVLVFCATAGAAFAGYSLLF